jgi:hypothetical protein
VTALGPDIGWHFQKESNEQVTFWRFAIGVWDVKLFKTSPDCAHLMRIPLPLIATTYTLSEQFAAIVPLQLFNLVSPGFFNLIFLRPCFRTLS